MVELGIILCVVAVLFTLAVISETKRVVRNVKKIAQETMEAITDEAIKENKTLNKIIREQNDMLEEYRRKPKEQETSIVEKKIREANIETFVTDLKMIQDRFALDKEKPVITTIISRIKKQYAGNRVGKDIK